MQIQDYLREKALLFDGAMGTYLMQQHPGWEEEKIERYNIIRPQWVGNIHRQYLEAGAAAIKTNTFGVSMWSRQDGADGMSVEKVIRAGWELAAAAVADHEKENLREPHYIFADLGPVWPGEGEESFTAYRKLVDVFLDCGADCFLFETLENADGLEQIASYIKKKRPQAFILVSFGVSPEGFTRGGCYGRSLFSQLKQVREIDGIGFNCISGPRHLLAQLEKLDWQDSGKYICVMPNAGYPTVIANRTVYANNHRYFAEAMREIAEKGAAILGGCCGTDPSYIRQLREDLEQSPVKPVIPAPIQPPLALEACQTQGREQEDELQAWSGAIEHARKNPRNSFAAKLMQGEKVIVVELDPPVIPEINTFMEGAARYKKAGVDGIDIADCPIARARIDSSLLACKVTRELGMTTIPHMTCRDRNINATKALLLGLNVEGVNNVLTVTGDPVPAAERQEVKTVFSYNSAILARHINTLNQVTFPDNPFLVCGALNINAVNFDSQLRHAEKKIENGVSVLFTQPVMTQEGLENLKRARTELPVKLLGGMIPVVSYRNACFMEHEISGIHVDDRIVELYRDKSREEGEELAVKIIKEIARKMEDYVDGYYLITPFQRIHLMERILREIR